MLCISINELLKFMNLSDYIIIYSAAEELLMQGERCSPCIMNEKKKRYKVYYTRKMINGRDTIIAYKAR